MAYAEIPKDDKNSYGWSGDKTSSGVDQKSWKSKQKSGEEKDKKYWYNTDCFWVNEINKEKNHYPQGNYGN